MCTLFIIYSLMKDRLYRYKLKFSLNKSINICFLIQTVYKNRPDNNFSGTNRCQN